MNDGIKAVEFVYQVRQVKTMSDHSFNIVLNLPEFQADQAAVIMKHIDCAGTGVLTFDEPKNLTESDDETKKGPKRSSIKLARRRS
jgi:hypothetical protein